MNDQELRSVGSVRADRSFIWELSLGVELLVEGFRPSALAALETRSPTDRLAPRSV